MTALPLIVFDGDEMFLDLETMKPTFECAPRMFNSNSTSSRLVCLGHVCQRTDFFFDKADNPTRLQE